MKGGVKIVASTQPASGSPSNSTPTPSGRVKLGGVSMRITAGTGSGLGASTKSGGIGLNRTQAGVDTHVQVQREPKAEDVSDQRPSIPKK